MIAMVFLAAAALVPWPKEFHSTGGEAPIRKAAYKSDTTIPKEGYRLSVKKDGTTVWSSTDDGRFYAEKTLEQLAENGKYPCCEITDAPAYPYRGFHVDEARHFFGKAAILKVIDEMSRLKMNYFHWHLTDDQGWRFELKKFPELTQYGSVRPNSPVFGDEWQRKNDGAVYGPFFYTEEDVKEVIAYAKARHIEIIPEIDIPGHCQALLAAYPDMVCEGAEMRKREPRCNWWLAGIRTLCIGNDAGLERMRAILDATMDLFPGKYLHFGGDECPDRYWAKCPKCQAKMKGLGLAKAHQLQGWLTKTFSEYLISKGRVPIGWHEILGGDPPKECVIMSWRGVGAGVSAARRGNCSIMTPGDWCYLNRWDGNMEKNEFTCSGSSRVGGTSQSMDHVYTYDPVCDFPENLRSFVLGGQVCVWTEHVYTPSQLEYRLFPRVGAIAERLWTAPADPDYADFKRRVEKVRAGQISRGISAAPIIDFAKITSEGDWKVRVKWGAQDETFHVKPSGSLQRLDWIARTLDGRLVYQEGSPVECHPERPVLGEGELLAGTVWVTANTKKLSDANLFSATARDFAYWRRSFYAWNAPWLRDFAPNACKKLKTNGKVKILFWGDEFTTGAWRKELAERLRGHYPKAEFEFASLASASATDFAKAIAEKPDMAISEFVADADPKLDSAKIYLEYEKAALAFKANGIEWLICLPHYVRPEKMGLKDVKEGNEDPRRYCNMLRRLRGTYKVGVADTQRYWRDVLSLAIPYPVLFVDSEDHIDAFAESFYIEAIEDQFRP